MRYFLFVLLFIFTTQVTTAVAKEEFWECKSSDSFTYIYKIDKRKPSVALRQDGEWKYYKSVVYDKENQNLSRKDHEGERDVFDLLLKKNIYLGRTYDCKVIEF